MTHRLLTHSEFDDLLRSLVQADYRLVGPRLRDGVITFDDIHSLADLPRGVTDAQTPGRYATQQGGAGSLLHFCATGQSLKRYFLPPTRPLFSLRKSANGPHLIPHEPNVRPIAVVGARGCDLAALRVLGGVLGEESNHPSEYFTAQRRQTFIVAVNCTTASSTSFCDAMGTGPDIREPFDLAITELPRGDTTVLVVEVGSDRGEQLLSTVTPAAPRATDDEIRSGRARVERTRQAIRALPVTTSGVSPTTPEALGKALVQVLESPHWEKVASRCLACTNCTMACPTCFCTTTSEQSAFIWDPDASTTEAPQLETTRVEAWESCFSLDHSYIHGGHVRASVASRYRQWLTHKFSTWWQQFGTSGCVGCGRCVTWCPAGIDIVAELGQLVTHLPQTSSPTTPALLSPEPPQTAEGVP